MSDMASLSLPDVGSLQPPPDLPDVSSLTEAPQNPGTVSAAFRGFRGGVPNISPGVVARFRDSDAVSNTIGALGKGAAEGFGSAPLGFSPENQQKLINAGFYPSKADQENPSVAGTLRFFNQSLIAPAAAIGDAFLRLFPAAIESARQGVTQAAKEAGAEAGPGGQAEQIGQEAAAGVEFLGTDAHVNMMLMSRAQYAEATRIAPNPAGGFYDQRIGPVPDHVEAAQQAATVAQHYGVPDAASAITEAYAKGVLPAEIFHDAKTNPTVLADLVEGKVPGAYPVSDWMGRETASEAVTPATAPKGVELRPNPIMQGAAFGDTTNAISHDIFEDGKKIGGISGDYNPETKQIVLTQVSAEPAPGPAVMRSILRQLQDRFPDAKTITGFRESGARAEVGGALSEMKMPGTPIIPTRLRPIAGTGELTAMQLSQSVEEAVGKVFDAVPASRVAENSVQEAAARKFVDMDPERADQVAMFGATPPKNLLGQMVFNEVLRRADDAGDFDKVRMLATQGAQSGMLRRFGQEVQAASRLGPEGDIADRIQQVQEKRTADLKAQGIDVLQAQAKAQAEFSPIREAMKTPKPIGAWGKFMQSIQCPE